jgi:hypothetical protein
LGGSLLKNKSIKKPENYDLLLPSDKFQIIIRGESFRSTDEMQIKCIESIINMIIVPLTKFGITVEINLSLYNNEKNHVIKEKLMACKLVSKIHENYCSIRNIKSQSESINYSLSFTKDTNVLILRPDLNIMKILNVDLYSKNNFHFQWNYFHNYQIREVPDQIHFIGEFVLDRVKSILLDQQDNLGVLPNGQGISTLHNLYNVLYEDGFSSISYLIDYKLDDDSFDGTYCKLRGNPLVSNLNDFYTYERTITKISFPMRCLIFTKKRLKKFIFWYTNES